MTRSKYKVDLSEKGKKERTVNGILFDSREEARFYKEIVLPGIEVGLIKHCKLQPHYELQPATKELKKIEYVADFELTYATGQKKVIDIKGMPTEAAKLKRKMFMYRYPDVQLEWLAYSKIDGGWIDYDLLKKKRAERKRQKKVKK